MFSRSYCGPTLCAIDFSKAEPFPEYYFDTLCNVLILVLLSVVQCEPCTFCVLLVVLSILMFDS